MKDVKKFVHKHIRKKPFLFMELPAEVRNRIYEYALENRNEPTSKDHTTQVTLARQRNIFGIHRAPRGALALLQVCRQVRRELQPLYMAVGDIRISVELRDLSSLLSTWYSEPNTNAVMQVSAPPTILIWVSAQDVLGGLVVDMRHLFLIMARNPTPAWYTNAHIHEYRFHLLRQSTIPYAMDCLLRVLEYAESVPDVLLEDVKSGVISEIKFVVNKNGTFKWLLTVVIEGATPGHLVTEEEYTRLEGYFEHLTMEAYIYMVMKLVNETGVFGHKHSDLERHTPYDGYPSLGSQQAEDDDMRQEDGQLEKKPRSRPKHGWRIQSIEKGYIIVAWL
ncbi:hypothetical protein TUN199_01584 [Pyrenophora tritici-repentis]|nr:hypothetical protein TUN199_01584 [Pyrenophora tritici-repentis]